MEEYISLLLETNNRVIIPEFGAFIVKKRHPLALVFNEFLQYNDGVLIEVISKKENIDKEQARAKIEQFIKQINESLDKGEAFEIEKLGYLVKNKSGKISLEESDVSTDKTFSNDKEFPLDQEKSAIIEEQPIIKEKKEIVTSSVETPKEKPVEKTFEKQEEIPVEKPKTITSSEINQPVAQKTEEKPVKEILKNQPVNPGDKKAAESPTNNNLPPVYHSVPKNKRNVLIWVIVIIAINAVIITYFFHYNKISDLFPETSYTSDELMPGDTTQLIAEKVLAADTTVAEVKTVTENQKISVPDKPNIEPQITTSGKRYYIVAGVFREEKNAKNFVKELKKKGFNSEEFGKIGSSFGVSYSVFESKSEAENALIKIKKETDKGAWIKAME
jgi:nucleoid DNA-binding protein/cell division septation protein DedD